MRLAAARDSLTAYSLANLGFGPRSTAVPAIPKSDEDDITEKQEKKGKKLLKRKLPAPTDGCMD